MPHLSRRLALTVVVAASLVATSSAQTNAIDKSYMGVWKLNVARSKYEPGPGPKEATRTHEDRGNGFVLIINETTNAQGQKAYSQYAYKPDGKEYPIAAKGQTAFVTIALKAIDPYTVEFTQKADGKAFSTGTRTVSKDGKTMTITTKGTNQQGQPTSSTAVWDKQPGRPTTE
jgi:hypothetical protein